jgi:Helicase HerA, central domain
MDAYTANFLSFAGVKCRVIGTFFVEQDQTGANGALTLKFGSDLSNYYPNRGLKVYKPNNEALNAIVNYRERVRVNDHPLGQFEVLVGRVRYASTDRGSQGIDTVRVHLAPADLLSQKTALFGMTRTGKSNTTKIIAKSIFELRFQSELGRVGQLIFDYNGEYANENVQDASANANPNALKNVWQTNSAGQHEDVVTYGSVSHPLDPDRRLMRINFYGENPSNLTDAAEIERAFRMVQVGKEIINHALEGERGSARYITNFLDVDMTPPDPTDGSAFTRYRRALLA